MYLWFNDDFIKTHKDDCDIGYFIEADVEYPENRHKLQNDLTIFPERMKIEKVQKIVANFHNKRESVIHIENFKKH